MTSQSSSILISSVYKSRKIVLELMEKQNYKVEDYANFSINEVNSMKQNNQLDMLLEREENKEKQLPKPFPYFLFLTSFFPPNETYIT